MPERSGRIWCHSQNKEQGQRTRVWKGGKRKGRHEASFEQVKTEVPLKHCRKGDIKWALTYTWKLKERSQLKDTNFELLRHVVLKGGKTRESHVRDPKEGEDFREV